ncbi:Transposon Tf2-6 polyprotein [Euphorbia peplus]|nr:Transposon Tf2-6 polyprotein [Euphorbia peplus]
MKIPLEGLRLGTFPLVGLADIEVPVMGMISLPCTFTDRNQAETVEADYVVVDVPLCYNGIMGRPLIVETGTLIDLPRKRILVESGQYPIIVEGDKRTELEVQRNTRAARHPTLIIEFPLEDHRGHDPRPAEPTVEITLARDRVLRIGTDINQTMIDALKSVLHVHTDKFAWSAGDISGIPAKDAMHSLDIDSSHPSFRQRQRTHSHDKQLIIEEELTKLLSVNFIKPVHYPDWLANVVLVAKPNGKSRMCVDFTSLNKACPKDCYPLPNIDQLVNSSVGHKVISQLDCISGFQQIPMNPDDAEKTSFITHKGTFCYNVMPFGLKNAGATYQRLMDKMFADLIGRKVHVYIDDMIVMSSTDEEHIKDLNQVFEIFGRFNLKLNPEKCFFGIRSGKFLGYIISEKGLSPNPSKVEAVMGMAPPTSLHEVQCLNGRIIALGRFISCSAQRCIPFYRLMRKDHPFLWKNEC